MPPLIAVARVLLQYVHIMKQRLRKPLLGGLMGYVSCIRPAVPPFVRLVLTTGGGGCCVHGITRFARRSNIMLIFVLGHRKGGLGYVIGAALRPHVLCS